MRVSFPNYENSKKKNLNLGKHNKSREVLIWPGRVIKGGILVGNTFVGTISKLL